VNIVGRHIILYIKKADSAKKNAIVNGNLYINQEKTIHNMENQNHKKPKEK
jgi:hypothetical protein